MGIRDRLLLICGGRMWDRKDCIDPSELAADGPLTAFESTDKLLIQVIIRKLIVMCMKLLNIVLEWWSCLLLNSKSDNFINTLRML